MLPPTLLLSGLSVYRTITTDKTVAAWIKLMEAIEAADLKKVVLAYHEYSSLAANHGWKNLILDLILNNDNIFSRTAAKGKDKINPSLKKLIKRDLALLEEAANYNAATIKPRILTLFRKAGTLDMTAEHPLHPDNWPEWDENTGLDFCCAHTAEAFTAAGWLKETRCKVKKQLLANPWQNCADILAAYHESVGCGIFGRFAAARWVTDTDVPSLVGIENPDPIRLEQLIGLENEKRILTENTEHLLAGLPANNMLLYGFRGTGKSSMVKALLQSYVAQGLRLVEIAKKDLSDFTRLCSILEDQPCKFIIFIDDLSFDENEPEYKALKTILEGTIAARPANVIVYATSNRRHLIKETYADRKEEIFSQDVLQEKLSLSDRFGIIVTFPSPDQESFLRIVENLAIQHGLKIGTQELRQMALRWEMWHNGRSGRTARQFIDNLIAQQAKGHIEIPLDVAE